MTTLTKSMLRGMFNGCPVCPRLLLVLLLFSPQLCASEMNLATAITLMSEQNPSLKIFEVNKRALGGKKYTAGLNPETELGIAAENFTGSKPFTSFAQSELFISLSSVIELGDKKKARKQFALSQYELLNAQRKRKSLELIAELTSLYIDILATQERIKLAEESCNLSRDIYQSVKRKAKAGAISEVEVKRSFAALEQAKMIYETEQNKLDRQIVSLGLHWSEKEPKFNRLAGNLFDFGMIKNFNLLVDNLEQSYLVQVLVMSQTMAESRLNVVNAESKPDISWSLGIRRFQENNDAALTAGISIPLFKRKRNKGALIEAEAEIDSLQSERQVTLLELYGQVHELYSLRQTAIQRYTILEKQVIPALTDALELTGDAYLEGRYGYLEYSAARADLIQSKKSLIDTAQNILKYNLKLETISAESIFIETSHTQGADS